MLGSKLMLCGTCRLAWYPEKKGVAAPICPACHHRGWRVPELFHLGVFLAAVGLGLAGAQFFLGSRSARDPVPGSAAAAHPARSAPSPHPARVADRRDPSRPAAEAKPGSNPAATRARVNANLQLKATAGPNRGSTVNLRRGDRVHILKKEGNKLLVQDRQGNQVYVKRDQLSTL